MSDFYILDCDHQPVRIAVWQDDAMNVALMQKWATWWEDITNRIVGDDQVGQFDISTVFLGIDHNFFRGGEPILFETMVFDNGDRRSYVIGGKTRTYSEELDGYTARHRTWDEALAHHQGAVKSLRRKLGVFIRAARAEARAKG